MILRHTHQPAAHASAVLLGAHVHPFGKTPSTRIERNTRRRARTENMAIPFLPRSEVLSAYIVALQIFICIGAHAELICVCQFRVQTTDSIILCVGMRRR